MTASPPNTVDTFQFQPRSWRCTSLLFAALTFLLGLPLSAQITNPAQPPAGTTQPLPAPAATAAAASVHILSTPRVEDVLPTNTADFQFADTPIPQILDHIAKSYGIVIINRQTIESRITLKLSKPLKAIEAINLLNDTLLPLGYIALEDVDGSPPHVELTIVTLSRNPPQTYIPVFRGANPREIGEGDELRTQIIPLQRLDPLMTSQRIESFLKKDPDIRVSLGARTLIVTDSTRNIKNAVTLIAALEAQAAARAAAATTRAASAPSR